MPALITKTKLLAAAIGLGLPLAMGSPAHAAPMLQLVATSGANTSGVVTSTTGSINYIGNVGSYYFTLVSGAGTPVFPEPVIDLGAIVSAFGGLSQAPLVIKLTQTGVTSPYSPLNLLTRLTSHLVTGSLVSETLQSYIDTSNTAFGTGTPLSTINGLNGTGTQVAAVTDPYSETLVLTLDFGTAAGGTSSDATITAIPEPAPVAILGFALLGLGMLLHRRTQA